MDAWNLREFIRHLEQVKNNPNRTKEDVDNLVDEAFVNNQDDAGNGLENIVDNWDILTPADRQHLIDEIAEVYDI